MRTNTLKRLEGLAELAEARANSPIWIDAHNTTVRIDVDGQRGEPLTFDTVHEAARYLEQQIDAHDRATGAISVDHLADLYPDGDALRRRLRDILPKPIQVGGVTYSADSLPAVVFGPAKTTEPANLSLWLLAGAIGEYFGSYAFRERYRQNAMTEDDNRLFTALFVVWFWGKDSEPDSLLRDFAALVHQVARLPAPETLTHD